MWAGGSKPEPGRAGGQRVAQLRAADRAPVDRLHLHQPGFPHAVEVGPDGVGVEIEPLGQLGGRQRRRRPAELLVDGEPRVVPECLEDGERSITGHQRLTVAAEGNIFKVLAGLMRRHEP